MSDQDMRDMREQLGLSRMLRMPDPTELGYIRDAEPIMDES